MAKELQIRYWCDNAESAKHKPRTVDGETLVVYERVRKELVDLDLCPPCQESITDQEVQELAHDLGREHEEREDAGLTCPYGCNDGWPYKSASGKGRHMTVKHGGDS